MRRLAANALVAVLVLTGLGIASGNARGDIPPRPPRPTTRPVPAGPEVPRPLHLIVSGLALAGAIAGAGVWLARGSEKARRLSGSAAIVAAAAILLGAGLLAYWSHAALRPSERERARLDAEYEAEKTRLDEEYQARLRNWRPRGPIRPTERPATPGSSPNTPAPGPS